MNIKDKLKQLPPSPGVYIFKDINKNILYVGKASSLKKRIRSYFQKRAMDTKRSQLVKKIDDIDYILTTSEAEALLYESQLIKRYKPKYNVVFKDDKAYPLLKLTINEKYPRLFIVRRKKDDDALYFGPYTEVGLLREALHFLRRFFPLRSCKDIPSKPCLYYHLGLCLAPCIRKVDLKEYGNVVKDLILFLRGRYNRLLQLLTERMNEASFRKDYEEAAKIRDQIKAFSKLVLREPKITSDDYLEDLRRTLRLKNLPNIIEAFDVSNIFGQQSVGAVVRFVKGKTDKNNYRRFKIKSTTAINDYQMMKEIVFRRYKRLKEDEGDLPDLIVIDGGRGHLNSAKSSLMNLSLDIPIISIAKEEELIYLLNRKRPVKLPPNSKALCLLQRIRDEAHRFAIAYHHILRRKLVKKSILKEIKGIGPKRYKGLIRRFGSIDEIKKASLEELLEVESLDEKSARNIIEYFKKMQ